MSYFSRLTDIVTCSLTKLLAESDNPQEAIGQIISEMEEGLAGANRSVATAAASEERLKQELAEHGQQIAIWQDKAKTELAAGNDERARLALVRKSEVEDLIAGLEQQYSAAMSTRQHLTTMHLALEARLAEALRKQQQLAAGIEADDAEPPTDGAATLEQGPLDASRRRRIDDELAALKRELGQS